jgi:DNA-binding transcriptional LysR family regulator
MSLGQYIEPALPRLCRFVPDRVIRRRPIRVIGARSPVPRPRAAVSFAAGITTARLGRQLPGCGTTRARSAHRPDGGCFAALHIPGTQPRHAVAWLHLDVPSCRRSLRLVWRRGVYLSAVARAFRDAATVCFGQSPST